MGIQEQGAVRMKKNPIVSQISYCISALICIGWAGESSKLSISFTGTVVTTQKDIIQVNSITIDDKIRDIPLYDTPVEHEKAVKNRETNVLEIPLQQEPHKYLPTTKIDLQNVSIIKVKQDPLWVYQEQQKRRISFVEITVTMNDDKKTSNSYLISESANIKCKAEMASKIIPILAIDTLTITGMEIPPQEPISSPTNKHKQ